MGIPRRVSHAAFAVFAGLAIYGGPAGAATTVGVSRAANGAFLGGFDPAISPDGGFVSFTSRGSGYVSGSSAFSQVYLRDMGRGQVRLMSISPANLYGNGDSFRSVVSRDGVRVMFSSAATNLVNGDQNGRVDVFARNPGASTTFLISRSTTNVQGNFDSETGDLTPDGVYLVFHSGATTFAPPDQSYDDIYLRDAGAFSTTRVSVSRTGGEANGNCRDAVVSDDGRYVAFWSAATDLLPGPDREPAQAIYRRDRAAGETRLVSITADGVVADSACYAPSISGDGRYVAFLSSASNLVPAETTRADAYVKDMETGVVERVQLGHDGSPANGEALDARISGNGRYVAFISTATNLVPGLVPAGRHVYVRDREAKQTVLASVASDGSIPENAYTSGVSIRDDGQYVAFGCNNALLPEDTNGLGDVYVRGPLWGAPGPYTLAEAADALRIACGIQVAGAGDLERLNVERVGASEKALDLLDGLRIARKASGLEPNP